MRQSEGDTLISFVESIEGRRLRHQLSIAEINACNLCIMRLASMPILSVLLVLGFLLGRDQWHKTLLISSIPFVYIAMHYLPLLAEKVMTQRWEYASGVLTIRGTSHSGRVKHEDVASCQFSQVEALLGYRKISLLVRNGRCFEMFVPTPCEQADLLVDALGCEHKKIPR